MIDNDIVLTLKDSFQGVLCNALLNVAPGRRMPMTGVGVSFLPVRVFTQQLFKKAKSKLSRETPTPVIGIHRL